MRGVVRKIAVPALAALVAWKASVLGLGDAYRASDAAFAARLDPAHATAVLALANQAVDADAACVAARDAVLGLLSTRPADGRAAACVAASASTAWFASASTAVAWAGSSRAANAASDAR